MKATKIKVWTAQSQIVLDTIEKNRVYHVKRAFILKKYRELSKLFLDPYDWFIKQAAKRITPPPEAEYPVWAYCDAKMISNYGPGDRIVELDVPVDQALFFNQGKWLRILNLSYIPENPNDEQNFKKKISTQGLQHPSQAYTNHFYPQLKKEIIASWERLFDESIRLSADDMCALWEIRKEWITKIMP
jgi:hypothetical protein